MVVGFLCLALLIRDTERVISAGSAGDLCSICDRWVCDLLCSDSQSQSVLIGSLWTEISELASQTPHTFADEWDTFLEDGGENCMPPNLPMYFGVTADEWLRSQISRAIVRQVGISGPLTVCAFRC